MSTAPRLRLADLPGWPQSMEPSTAAAYLDVSETFFNKHIRGELEVVRKSGKTLYPRPELDRWVDENMRPVLEAA